MSNFVGTNNENNLNNCIRVKKRVIVFLIEKSGLLRNKIL